MDKNGSEGQVCNPVVNRGDSEKKEERMSLWQRRMQRKAGQPASDKTFHPVAQVSRAKAKKSRQREPAQTPIEKKAEGPDYAVFNALKSWSIPKQQSVKP